jgi:hypothetical protein
LRNEISGNMGQGVCGGFRCILIAGKKAVRVAVPAYGDDNGGAMIRCAMLAGSFPKRPGDLT